MAIRPDIVDAIAFCEHSFTGEGRLCSHCGYEARELLRAEKNIYGESIPPRSVSYRKEMSERDLGLPDWYEGWNPEHQLHSHEHMSKPTR